MSLDPRLPVAVAAVAALGVAGLTGSVGTGGLGALLPGVALAAVLTTLTLDRTGRRLVGLVAVSAGLGMAALGFWGQSASDPASEPASAIVPIAYGVLGLLVAAASAWLVARPPARRARGVRGAGADVTDPLASWKAMDEGLDPTDEESERA